MIVFVGVLGDTTAGQEHFLRNLNRLYSEFWIQFLLMDVATVGKHLGPGLVCVEHLAIAAHNQHTLDIMRSWSDRGLRDQGVGVLFFGELRTSIKSQDG